MVRLIDAPVRILVPGGKVIDEYVGRVATQNGAGLGGPHAGAGRWDEPAQAPEFDEITVVLEAAASSVEHDGGSVTVAAGQALFTAAGERVRLHRRPRAAPTMSPSACRRSRSTSPTARSDPRGALHVAPLYAPPRRRGARRCPCGVKGHARRGRRVAQRSALYQYSCGMAAEQVIAGRTSRDTADSVEGGGRPSRAGRLTEAEPLPSGVRGLAAGSA